MPDTEQQQNEASRDKVDAPAQKDEGERRDDRDEPLGDAGKRALEREREDRKRIERELAQLKQGLASVAGVEPNKMSAEELVAAQNQRIARLELDNHAQRVALSHGISDPDDLALISSMPDRDAMSRVAARLAATPAANNTDADHSAPRTPRPDPSIGRGSGTERSTGSVSAGRDLFKQFAGRTN